MTKNGLHQMIRWLDDESSMTGLYNAYFCLKLGELKDLLVELYEFFFQGKVFAQDGGF